MEAIPDIEYGKLENMEWLISKGCPRDETTFFNAVLKGFSTKF
jgi:hypothetical protein